MLLGGVGEALILKWVGAKLTGVLATHLAHSSGAVCMNFAMHSANAALVGANTAAATGGALGAATALYHGASANRKLFKKVMEKRDELGISEDVNPSTEEEAGEMLIGIALGMLAQGYYESLEHKNCVYNTKDQLSQIEPCEKADCDCNDYEHGGDHKCVCGHYNFEHSEIDPSIISGGDLSSLVWLWQGIAEQIYPELQNRDGEGDHKTGLNQIDTCTFSSCPCHDFDLCEANQLFSRRCSCGHRWREHTVTGSWEWIIMVLAQLLLATMVEAAEKN